MNKTIKIIITIILTKLLKDEKQNNNIEKNKWKKNIKKNFQITIKIITLTNHPYQNPQKEEYWILKRKDENEVQQQQ